MKTVQIKVIQLTDKNKTKVIAYSDKLFYIKSGTFAQAYTESEMQFVFGLSLDELDEIKYTLNS